MVAIRTFANTHIDNTRSLGGGVLDHVLANIDSNTRHVLSCIEVLFHRKTNIKPCSVASAFDTNEAQMFEDQLSQFKLDQISFEIVKFHFIISDALAYWRIHAFSSIHVTPPGDY